MRILLLLVLLLTSCGRVPDKEFVPETKRPAAIWEKISDHCKRMRVYRGWLVVYDRGRSGGITFVPDATGGDWRL